nr:MAG TPA: hypothetical protein [Caudoviricetes sp.]
MSIKKVRRSFITALLEEVLEKTIRKSSNGTRYRMTKA